MWKLVETPCEHIINVLRAAHENGVIIDAGDFASSEAEYQCHNCEVGWKQDDKWLTAYFGKRG